MGFLLVSLTFKLKILIKSEGSYLKERQEVTQQET